MPARLNYSLNHSLAEWRRSLDYCNSEELLMCHCCQAVGRVTCSCLEVFNAWVRNVDSVPKLTAKIPKAAEAQLFINI